jgi:50S ribosomal subunit-associated GTPase HflX
MNELGVPMTKVLYVMNKVDLTRIEDAFDKSTYLDMLDSKKRVLPVSAKTEFNIDQLKNIMTSLLFPEKSRRPDDEHKEEECNEGISS